MNKKFFGQMVKVLVRNGEIMIGGYDESLGTVEKVGKVWIAKGRGKQAEGDTRKEAISDLMFRIEYR